MKHVRLRDGRIIRLTDRKAAKRVAEGRARYVAKDAYRLQDKLFNEYLAERK